MKHRLGLELNEIGERWAVTLKVLVDAELSRFGAHLKQIPTALFIVASVMLVLAMGVTQLWAIISA